LDVVLDVEGLVGVQKLRQEDLLSEDGVGSHPADHVVCELRNLKDEIEHKGLNGSFDREQF
jgi:hypothetical protein